MRNKLKEPLSHLDTDRSRKRGAYAVEEYCYSRASIRVGRAIALSALYALEELAERHFEGSRKCRQMAKPNFTRTALEVGDVDLVNTGLFGKVDLPPTPFLSELPNSFAKLDANIRRHSSSIDLVEALYLVDALSREIRVEDGSVVPVLRIGPGLPGAADDTTAVAGTSAQSENLMNSSTREGIAAMCCGLLKETVNDDSL